MATTEEILRLKTQVDGAQSVTQFRQAIRDINAALAEVPRGSAAFRELQGLLAAARDDAADFREEIEAIHPENLGNTMAKTGALIAQGFGAAQAAAALFGEENEEIQKAIMKVQAAQQLASSLTLVSEAKKQAATLKTIALKSLEAAETKAGIVATEGMTIAQRALNLVMNASPIGAIVAAVAILAAATAGIIKLFSSEKTEVEKLTKEYEQLQFANEIRAGNIKMEIDLLKAKGAAVSEIIIRERQLLELQLQNAKKNTELERAKLKEEVHTLTFMESLYVATGNMAKLEESRHKRAVEGSKDVIKAKQEEAAAQNAITIQVQEQIVAQRQLADQNAKLRAQAAGGREGALRELQIEYYQRMEEARKNDEDQLAIIKLYNKKEAEINKEWNEKAAALAKQKRDAEIADLELYAKIHHQSRENEVRRNELAEQNAIAAARQNHENINLVVEDYRQQRATINKKWDDFEIQLADDARKELEKRPLALSVNTTGFPTAEEIISAAEFSRSVTLKGYEQQKTDLELHYKELGEKNAEFYTKGLIDKEQYEKNQSAIQKAETQARVDLAVNTLGNALDVAKGMFEEGSAAYKGIAVAQATIDTFKSAQSAYASLAGVPVVGPALGVAAAAAAVIAGIKNVQKILSVDPKGSSSAPSASSASTQSAFSAVATPPGAGTPGFQTSTNLNPDGTIAQQNSGQQPININLPVVISSVEMTTQQQQVAQIQDNARL